MGSPPFCADYPLPSPHRKPTKAARRGVRLPMPPTGRIRPMPSHPSGMMPREVGRARHARHAPDIEKAMSGGEKR